MHLIRLIYSIPLAAVVISLACLLAVQSRASSAQHNAAELFRPREQLAYFEIYHTDSRGLYRTVVALESLISGKTEVELVRSVDTIR